MSTSTYYNFMTADKTPAAGPAGGGGGGGVGTTISSLATRRQSAMSPSSFAASYSSSSNTTSSSSLNQFISLTQTGAANGAHLSPSSSSSNYSSSSVASSTASTPPTSNLPAIRNQHNQHNHHHHHHQQRDLQRKTSMLSQSPQQLQQLPQHHSSQMFHSYTLHSLEPKSFKPFKTKSDYIEAMKEDLAEWLNQLYPDIDLTAENFFAQLETGAIICRHANNVTLMGRNLIHDSSSSSSSSSSETNQQTNCPNESSSYGSEPANNSHRASSNSPMSSASSNDFSLCSTSTPKSALLSPRQSVTSLSRMANGINWFRVKMIPYKEQAKPGTFFARDNICQFILWCRSLNILECLLFETDDLVARKNEKSFILCLLEVARIGFKVGMPTPLIIQFEQEIDREIEREAKLQKELEEKQNHQQEAADSLLDDGIIYGEGESCDTDESRKTSDDEQVSAANEEEEEEEDTDNEKKHERSLDGGEQEKQSEAEDDVVEEDYGPKPQVITNDLVSLHEKVVQLLCQCTCPTQFPMVRVGDNGKYKIGDKLIIFVRILRRHIMVRVGGGWQELSEFLRAKDPCRSKQQLNGGHQHHGSQSIRQASFSAVSSRSRLLLEGGNTHLNPLNKSHHHHRHLHGSTSGVGGSGHRLISGSASMSWIANNS